MLDPAPAADRLEGVQGNGVGPVADGVHSGFDAVRGGVPHEPDQFVRGGLLDAVGAVRALQSGVGVTAQGGTGVERTVREELQRPDLDQAPGRADLVPRTQPALDRSVQAAGVDGGRHPYGRPELGRSPFPVHDRVAELEVDDTGDPARGGGPAGLLDPPVDDVGRRGGQSGQNLVGLVLPDQPGGVIPFPTSARQAELSHAACRSALTNATGRSGSTASSSALCGASGHSPSRKPYP